MLGFLHTAKVHVDNFERLTREVDGTIPTRHAVREDLLAEAVAAGKITDRIVSATADALRALADDGAWIIVSTCSTIGAVAEKTTVGNGVPVMRVDRPMAEKAVATGDHILVLAALGSTFQSTVALLRETSADAARAIEITEVLCDGAWRLFELSDHVGYAAAIAKTIESTARHGDVVVLAQASMAPAAELVQHLGIPVLASPRLGVEAAIAKHRARASR